MNPVTKTAVLTVSICLVGVCSAGAAPIKQLLSGNDCGNHKCVANEAGTFEVDANVVGSPFIIKFKANGTVEEVNSALFPSVTGSEWDFTADLSGSLTSGSWVYSPGPGDPAIRFWTAKGGPVHNLFYDNGADGVGPAVPVTSGAWSTPINPKNKNGNGYGLSHLSFFDTAVPVNEDPPVSVPEPGSLLLLAFGVLGVGRRLRRR